MVEEDLQQVELPAMEPGIPTCSSEEEPEEQGEDEESEEEDEDVEVRSVEMSSNQLTRETDMRGRRRPVSPRRSRIRVA